MTVSKSKLTPKQQAFIERYLVSYNGAESARLAGYSPKTARFQAAALLTNPNVKAAIAERIKELTATTNEVWTRLTAMSRGSMDDFVRGESLDLDRARDRGVMHLIKKVKVRTTTISKSEGEDIETHETEVELYDAQSATVQLAKLLGMFPSPTLNLTFDWRDKAKELGLSAEAETLADELFEKAIAGGGVVIEHEPSDRTD